MIRNNNVAAAAVRDHFFYDPETGVLLWKQNFHKNRIGKVAGGTTQEGYRSVRIDGQTYCVHRIAWAYVHGVWPTLEIDHINRDRADNRIANLRQVTTAENQHNQAFTGRKGTSPLLGAHFNKQAQRWQSSIIVNNKAIYLGLFETDELAHAAYCAAKKRFHPSNPVVGSTHARGI